MIVKATHKFPCGQTINFMWYYFFNFGYAPNVKGIKHGRCPLHGYKCKGV